MHTVIVGAGAGGAVVAERLSRRPEHRVTLLEAGPDYPPEDLPPDLRDGRRNSYRAHDWGFRHRPHPAQVRLPFPRGRVVGGSSAVNTAIALRGAPADFDDWAAAGLPEWSWARCLPAFQAIERDLDFGDDPAHGADGRLPVRRAGPGELSPWAEAFLEAAAAEGWPMVADLNAPGARGAGVLPKNLLRGERMSAARCWLDGEVRARTNLTVVPFAQAHEVVFEGRAARAVRGSWRGEPTVWAADRVVLAAGAVLTPALLQRSGIGPASELERLGVPVRADLPAVGARLLDHPGSAWFLIPTAAVRGGNGEAIQVAAVLGHGSHPDLQLQPGSFVMTAWGDLPLVSLMIALCRPRGSGRWRLPDAKPDTLPLLEPNFFTDPLDRDAGVDGLQRLAALAARPALARRARLLRWRSPAARLPTRCDSGYHPCGTAPLGEVTDACGRVRGVECLWLADASLFPSIPSNNIHLPTLMLAHRIGGFLAESAD